MKRTGAVLVAVVMATSSSWLATGGHAAAESVPTTSARSTSATGCPATLSKPLTEAGKEMFAFDKYTGIYPGSTFGVVRMNAHVWPDGSAVGNRMLNKLKIGHRIVVLGKTKKICYRVTDKVVIDASNTLPRYYRTWGKPRLGIVVCSGKRLGPGVWTKRTVWFAKPSA